MFSRDKARRQEAEIVLQPYGFSKSLSGHDLFHVLWANVHEIRAYKRDLLTTDLVCLSFRDTETDEWWEVHEEMAG